jgi:hypothetical protein
MFRLDASACCYFFNATLGQYPVAMEATILTGWVYDHLLPHGGTSEASPDHGFARMNAD